MEIMNAVQKSLSEYIDMTVDMYQGHIGKNNMYARLQKEGQFFTPLQHRPCEYPLLKLRSCFYNAYMMLIHPELEYCEGIAYSGLIPVHHGWNVDKDGNVVDVTWRTRGKHSKFSKGREYFGIIIPRNEIDDAIYSTKTYGYWKEY